MTTQTLTQAPVTTQDPQQARAEAVRTLVLLPNHHRVYSDIGPWPHVRHIARINHVTYPTGYFDTGAAEVSGDIAITLCGRFMRSYWIGDTISDKATDDSLYLLECAKCLDRAAAARARANANAIALAGGDPQAVYANGITVAEDIERR